jgi:hypothetical protein
LYAAIARTLGLILSRGEFIGSFYPAHKSEGARWVRVASSAQSWQEAHWETMGRPVETARWKRRVPRLARFS